RGFSCPVWVRISASCRVPELLVGIRTAVVMQEKTLLNQFPKSPGQTDLSQPALLQRRAMLSALLAVSWLSACGRGAERAEIERLEARVDSIHVRRHRDESGDGSRYGSEPTQVTDPRLHRSRDARQGRCAGHDHRIH